MSSINHSIRKGNRISIYNAIRRCLMDQKKAIIATILNKDGSAPRNDGAKMLIGKNNDYSGSIGGGILEAKIID